MSQAASGIPSVTEIVFSFLASTHYTHYNPWLFAINVTALVFNLIPKLPQVCRFHRIPTFSD